MSLHKFAEQVASQGRGDDSLLVHMTPEEVRNLQQFAQANGTTLTINPNTGLPEAGLLSDLFKAVAPIALGAFLGPGAFGIAGLGMSAGMAGAAVGGLTTLATGSLSRGLMAGLGAYGGAGMAEGLMGAGAGAAQQSAMGALTQDQITTQMAESGLTQQGVLNQAAADATKNALANTGQAVSSGFNVVTDNPSAMGSFAKDNFKYLAAAASPIMADMMTPTVTKMPELQSNSQISKYIRNEDGTLRHLYNAPAANYGTPAYKPFAEGGIVALAGGGDLNNIYANLGGKQVYDKITADYLKAGGTEAGLPSIFAAYDKPVAAPAAAAPVVAAPAAPNLNNIYANLGGKQVYDKIASDYLKAGGTEAGLPSILSKYDTPVAAPAAVVAPAAPAALTADQKAAMALMFKSSTGGVDTAAMDALGGSAAVKKLAESAGYTGDATQLYNYAVANPGSIDFTSDAGKQLSMNNYIGNYTKDITTKFKTPAEQALELMYRSSTQGAPTAAFDALGGYSTAKKLAESAGFEATPEWQQAYEKKMGYTVIPRMSTAETIAADKAASLAATSGLATLPRVDAGADTRLDYTGDGTSTVKPVSVTSKNTYNTVAGNTYVPPPIGTAVGEGVYQGQGTMASSGTQGPIVDFTGKTAFTSNPLALAKTQIAEQAAAKTAADKAKLDLYSQFGIQNPTATKLDHVNFIDKIGLAPETAAQLLNISPDQAKDAYYDTKFNQQTGDSMAAYKYLMGQGAYPTKSGVGEIARPYAEATLGYPASTNKQYIYDKETGRYNRNPDYVAEYQDPTGATNYALSTKEIFDYFKANSKQDDATTYAWALANNLTAKEIADATGVPISQIAPKWRAAAAKQAASKDTKTVAAGANTVTVGGTNYDTTDQTQQPPEDNNGEWYWDAGEKKWVQYGRAAAGGLQTSYAMGGYAVGGGLGSLGSYSDGGRLLRGPGDGVSDSIPATIGQKQQPARLADGEFVVPARIVSELGNGSTEAGAKKLYAMMDRVQRARGKTTGKNKVAANSRADKYLPA